MVNTNGVLVVEDEPLVRMMIVDALRDAGLEDFEAESADEAVLVLSNGANVDLIMADLRMPGTMDGLGLMKLLRKTRPDLKLVVASGYSPDWPSPNFVDAFIGKPYDVERTVQRIKTLAFPRPLRSQTKSTDRWSLSGRDVRNGAKRAWADCCE